MGFHTIKEGDQALVFSSGGQGTLVVGPRRVRRLFTMFLACSKF